MLTQRDSLIAAYRTTSYWVDAPRLAIRLRVGEHNEQLDRILEERAATRWAFITAHNPGSIRSTNAANAERQRELRATAVRRGFAILDGRGIGDACDWVEESILIPGADEATAREIGVAFGQIAVLCGERGGAPRLIFCATEGQSPK